MTQNANWDSSQSDDDNSTLPDENFDSTAEEPTVAETAATSDNSSDNADLQQQLDAANARIAELTNISQQALADLQNFRKRSEEDKANFVSFANTALITDLLPALDNIERALAHIPDNAAAKEWAHGIIATMKQFEQVLETKGLEKIESEREDFDPQYHEALMTEEGDENKVMRQLEKGYKMGKKVLRRAKVAVGHGKGHKKGKE